MKGKLIIRLIKGTIWKSIEKDQEYVQNRSNTYSDVFYSIYLIKKDQQGYHTQKSIEDYAYVCILDTYCTQYYKGKYFALLFKK